MAAATAALVPWAHPSTRCERAGAALAVSYQEGVIAARRSMTASCEIKRPERRNINRGRGGIAGVEEDGGKLAGMPSVVVP